MKHLRAFEELNRDTYFDAANKLSKSGHTKRADIIRKHADKIKYNDDEFSYYTTTTYTNVVNPILKIDTIADMKVSITAENEYKEPNRTILNRFKGNNTDPVVNHVADVYKLVVIMSKGDRFEFELGKTKVLEFYGPDEKIQFKDRKEAYKFVKMCNNFIREEIGKAIPINLQVNTLNVNDFYRN